MIKIRIASRASPLAVVQAKQVAVALSCEVELITTESAGDKIAGSLADVGGKELFVDGVRRLLVQGKADCAVHSLKDMAAESHDDFRLAAIGFAEDVRDVFISQKYPNLAALPTGAKVGTCSPRRMALLSRYASQVTIVPMRGNIQTRLNKLSNNESGSACDALILAAAGLRRLGFIDTDSKNDSTLPQMLTDATGQQFYYDYLAAAQFIPAPGQGLLAVECLRTYSQINKLQVIADTKSTHRAMAERAFTRTIGGDCHTPLGAHAVIDGEQMILHAFYVHDKNFMESQVKGLCADAESLGVYAANEVLASQK